MSKEKKVPNKGIRKPVVKQRIKPVTKKVLNNNPTDEEKGDIGYIAGGERP